MRTLIKKLLVLMLLACIGCAHAAAPTTKLGKKSRVAGSVLETVALNSSTPSFTTYTGNVGYTGDGLIVVPDSSNSAVLGTVVSVPVMPYANGTKTKAEIEAQAKLFFLPYGTSVGNSLKTWMKANNFKASSFIYEHEVGVAGYSCSVGSVSGSQCVTTTSVAATPNYSCPSGAVLSGTTCVTTTSTPATPNYACQSGQSLSGTTCTQTSTSTSAANVTYTCPSGKTVSGASCVSSTVSTSAATVNYSCPSGGTLSGSSCVSSSSYGATPNYSCPSGQTLSGSTCIQSSSSPANPIYVCSSGVLNGTTCIVTTTTPADVSYPQMVCDGDSNQCWFVDNGLGNGPTYSCSSGTLSDTNCITTTTISATFSRYSCSPGRTLSGSSCISTTSSAVTVSSYSCPSGGTVSGSTCTTTSSTAASVSYSCASGQTLSGSTCSLTTTSTSSATPNYSCPSGQTLSGTSCILTTTSSSNAAIASYSCPAGTTLSGSSCLLTTTAPASIASYSCSTGVVSGSTCVISVYTPAIPSGGARTMKLTWQVSVMDGGRVMFGDPRVIDADPTYVYVIYTSKSVASGLPSAWTYTDAGILKWQLRRRDGTPVTSWTNVDTGGVYDEPTASGSDPNFGVNCLANKASDPACPQSSVDVSTLMSMTSSIGSIIDYVRQVQPLYDNSTDPATGQPIQVARIAMSVDSRTLTPNDCTHETYRNTGRYGFALATTLDRFSFNPSSWPVFVNQYISTSMSPTSAYDYTTSTSLTTSQLQSQVINPFNANGPLVAVASIANLTYLAPITVVETSSPLEITGYSGEGLASHSGTWNGRIFTIDAFSGQRDQDQGFYRNSIINLNVPLCSIEYAKVTKNWANKEGLIAVNNQPVAMTDSWQFYLTAPTSLGQGPLKKAQISALTSAFTGSFMPGMCDVNNSCSFSGPSASTNLQAFKAACTAYSPPIDYCDDSGCSTYTTCTAYNYSPTGQNASAIWVLAGSGSDDDTSVPIDFTSKLVNGANQILLQHGIWGLGYQQIRIEIKLKDY